MQNRLALSSVAIAVVLLVASCADFPEGPFHRRDGDDGRDTTGQTDTTNHTDTTDHSDTTGNSGGGTGPRDTTVCFTRDVLPILISNCTMAECHDAYKPEEGVNLTSYDAIMRGRKTTVVPGSPSSSELYRSLLDKDIDERMPPPPRSLSNVQIAIIERWIREGAKNRDCSDDASGGCNTTDVTYTATIAPIMAKWCTGCHGGVAPSAGMDLTNRVAVEAQARMGLLVGTVTHASGYTPMPPGGSKIDECSIAQINAWIATGMK